MKNNMGDAYQLEMDLIPIFLEMEMKGVPISKDVISEEEKWTKKFQAGEDHLHSIVGDVKLGGKTMFNVLRKKGYIDEDKIEYTDKGNPRYGRDFLPGLVEDEKLKEILILRSKLQKVLGTYLRPWKESYLRHGRFFPYFQQTRGDNDRGARTGRVSSNLQQIPADIGDHDVPNLRKMITAEDGHIILKRDYAAQEIRVAAHYAEGSILQAYKDTPDLDVHTFVQDLIAEKTGLNLSRRIVKGISFLKLYGGGPARLADHAHCSIAEAKEFFSAYNDALPEFLQLSKDVEDQVKSGVLLRTWGGRKYGVDPPKYIDGKYRDFYYKLVNTLIQGSSADMSKVAMKRFHDHPDRKGRILLVVHDEIVLTTPEEHKATDMEILKWAMEEIPGWDVPLVSDAKIGKTFGDLEDYHD